MKVKISRSFSLKRQIKPYEPAEWFCAVEAEVEEKEMKKYSEKLDKFCQTEVEKSEINYLTPPGEVKFDEEAPANIKEEPVWQRYKKDFGKMYGPGIKNRDIAENAQTDAELDTIQEI